MTLNACIYPSFQFFHIHCYKFSITIFKEWTIETYW